MKKRHGTIAALCCALALFLSMAVSTACSDEGRSGYTDERPYAEKAADVNAPSEVRRLGDLAYSEGNYEEAEAYFSRLLEFDGESISARNNLGLAFLHQERNEDAFEMFGSLLKDLLPNEYSTTTYGVFLNLMVAGHACGKSVPDVLSYVDGMSSPGQANDLVQTLCSEAKDDPGTYTKLLEGIFYNAVYMDMEQNGTELADRIGTGYFGFYTRETPLDAVISEGMIESFIYSEMSERVFGDLLGALNNINEDVYGSEDPDIGDLLEYLGAMEDRE